MKEDLVKALQDVHLASSLIDEVLVSIKPEDLTTDPKQVAAVKQRMHKPTWTLKTKNVVEGVIGEDPIKLEALIEGALDIETLWEQVDKMKTFDTTTIETTVAQLKSQPQGEELAQVLLSAILPRAYGAVTKIEVVSSLFPVTATSTEELMELVALDGLVHVNYAPVLARRLPSPINVDGLLFQNKCWVNLEFLQGNEPFEKSFSWQDETNGQLLSITITAAFSRK